MKKILFTILCVLLYSCSNSNSDSGSEEQQNVPAGFLKQITTSGMDSSEIYKYYYNGNKISKISKVSTFPLFSNTKKIKYTGDLITEISEYDTSERLNSKYIFEYNSLNKLISSVFLNYSKNEASKNIISYNSNETVSVSTYTGNFTSQTVFVFSAVYNFSNNDVVSCLITYNNTFINSTYEYDTNDNPLNQITGYKNLSDFGSGINLIPFLRNGSHNCLKSSYSGGNVDCPIIAYNAVYNSNNYPISMCPDEAINSCSDLECFQLEYQ